MEQDKIPYGVDFAADAARILDEAKIPSVLMGWLAMCLYKRPNDFGDITLVIPDDLIDSAKNALLDKYPLCTDRDCMELEEKRPGHPKFHYGDHQLTRHPKPEHHFHARVYEIIYLVRQSDFLWWLPNIPLELPDKNDLHLTVTTDEALRSPGPWLGKHPVRVLKPSSFVEALLYLWMRDFRDPNSKMWLEWDNLAHRMKVDWDYNPEIPESQKRLREEFQRAWDYYCLRYPKSLDLYRHSSFETHRLGLLYLREKLIKEDRFLSELPNVELPKIKELEEV
ncbi:hypothetical protein BDV18DRAFT_157378 [Aspergillus unguis]